MQLYHCNDSRIPRAREIACGGLALFIIIHSLLFGTAVALAVSALSNWWSSALRKALDRFDKGAQEMRPSFCHSAKFNSSKDQTNVGTGLLKETAQNLSCSQHPGLFTHFSATQGRSSSLMKVSALPFGSEKS